MRSRTAALIATLALAVVPIAVSPTVAGAAGTGEFCGPGWQRVTTPTSGRSSLLRDLDGGAGDLWAVGSGSSRRGAEITLVERWGGSGWDVTSSPHPGATSRLHGVSAWSSSLAWAVGSRARTARDRTLTIRWDGATWTRVASPNGSGPNVLREVVLVAPDDAWAVGQHGRKTVRTLVEHWDGAAWSVVAAPNPGTAGNALWGVTAASPTNVVAVGVRTDAGGSSPLVMRWDGVAWTTSAGPTGIPPDQAFLDADVAPDGDLWTAGGAALPQPPAGGLAGHRIGAVWTSWTSSTARWTGISSRGDDDTWAGGEDGARGRTQHWDGTAWTQMPAPPGRGTGATDRISAVLTISADEVWAIGSMRAAGNDATMAMRLCPMEVTDAGFGKTSSRVSQGSGTLWRFSDANGGDHDVTDALGLGPMGAALFGTGTRSPGTTGTFLLDHAGTFPVVDTATGHTALLTVPTEAAPKKAVLGSTFTVFTSATATLPSGLGTDIRYRKPGSEIWYRLVTGTTSGATAFTPDQVGIYRVQARLKNKGTGVTGAWSPWATINVAAP